MKPNKGARDLRKFLKTICRNCIYQWTGNAFQFIGKFIRDFM